jgi:hypothetical protein
MICRICSTAAPVEIARLQVLARHSVGYYSCACCGYVQTEPPTWLAEAYASPITLMDTGALARVLQLSAIARAVLAAMSQNGKGKCLDFGGGHGLFVRRMRDLGENFRWEDPYCKNLHARGFEATVGERGFVMATCFEVLEHLENPVDVVRGLLDRAEVVLCSTELVDAWPGRFADWPYVAAEHGQHIGFFSRTALRQVAHLTGSHLISDGRSVHCFSRRRWGAWRVRMALHPRWARWSLWWARPRSLTLADSRLMAAQMRGIAPS